MVVDLCDGADGRSAAPGGHFLFDGDGRGQVVNAIDVWFFEPACELPNVSTQGLDIAPLAFRVQCVEGEGALSGSAQARHHGQGPQGQIDVHIFQVVDTGAADADDTGSGGHGAKFGHGVAVR